jgi:hypothetical protein
MITIESDRTAGAIQTIAAEILGHHVGVTQSGRLGNEITLHDGYGGGIIEELLTALGANGHGVEVTHTTPRPVMTAKSVRIPDDLWRSAQVKADQRGEVLSDVIRKSLARYVKRA